MDHTTGHRGLYWKFTPQIPISFLLTAHHTMYSGPRGIYMANLQAPVATLHSAHVLLTLSGVVNSLL